MPTLTVIVLVIIIIIIIIIRQFIRCHNMSRVTTRAPYNVKHQKFCYGRSCYLTANVLVAVKLSTFCCVVGVTDRRRSATFEKQN